MTVKTQLARWSFRFVLLFGQVVLILASGCGPGPTPIVFDLSTPTSIVPTAVDTAIPTVVASGPATPTATPFVGTASIKLFSNIPLSGEQADSGTDIQRGIELAIRQLSGPLNELGYQVQVEAYDDQNNAAAAVANADALITNPEIVCGIGHLDPQITLAASEVYHEAGLAFVAPTVTLPLLTDQSFLEVSRLVGREDGQGFAAAQFAREQGYDSVFIVSQGGETRLLNVEYFRTETGDSGIQWLGSALTNINNENRAQIVQRVMKAQPDVVYIASSPQQAIPFLSELRAAGYTGAFLGTEELNDPSLISEAGPALIEGGLFYTITNPPAQYFTEAARFIQDFNSRYGTSPSPLAARAYDATGICLEAIETAAQGLDGTLPARGDVARALRSINGYRGITGSYNFNRQGDPDPVEYYILQVTSVDAASWDQNPIVAAYPITPP